MKKTTLFACCFYSAVLLVAAGLRPVSADDTEPTPAPQVSTPRTNASAIRMALVNGVFNKVNNTKTAPFKLDWEPLPHSASLDDWVIKNLDKPSEAIAFDIRNEDLKRPDTAPLDSWISLVPLKYQAFMKDALAPTPVRAGEDFWLTQGEPGYDQAGRISGQDYKSSLRDCRLVKLILQSNGIACSIGVSSDKVRGDFGRNAPLQDKTTQNDKAFPRLITGGIVWHFKGYRRLIAASPPNPVAVSAYRFSVKVSFEPFTLMLEDPNETDVTVTPRIKFRDSPALAGLSDDQILLDLGDVTGTAQASKAILSPDDQSKLTELTDTHSASSLEVLLSNISGTSANDLVTKGLLGGTQDASVITGGLLGRGGVDQAVGINLEKPILGPNTGITIASTLGGDNSAFAGLSLRSGPALIAIGPRAYEKDDPNGTDKKTKFGLAGMLSIDLSRLTRQKTESTAMTLKNPVAGGSWGDATDDLTAGLIALRYTLVSATNTPLPATTTVTLRQITDANGQVITDETKRTKVPLIPTDPNLNTVINNLPEQQIFIPAGAYAIDTPAGSTLTLPSLVPLVGTTENVYNLMPGKASSIAKLDIRLR